MAATQWGGGEASRRAGWLARRAAVLVAVATASGAAACDNDVTGPEQASAEENVAYIDGIVPHHQIALMRADEALQKAVRPGLRAIAQRVKDDQGREIAAFRAVKRELVGVDTTPRAMMPQPIPAGPDFDRQWLLSMINHHQGAIDMSTLALGAGVRSPLDTLARHTIDEQRREQRDFRDSIRVWYGTQ